MSVFDVNDVSLKRLSVFCIGDFRIVADVVHSHDKVGHLDIAPMYADKIVLDLSSLCRKHMIVSVYVAVKTHKIVVGNACHNFAVFVIFGGIRTVVFKHYRISLL